MHGSASLLSAKQLLVEIERTVRRALVARNGLDVGSDAASEAMTWALENPERIAAMANPAGYLYRVGQSAARRQRRWNARQPSLAYELATKDHSEPFDADLFRALAQLRHSHRVAVVLVHCYAYSYQDVASLLGIKQAAVTNHVHRGLARLRVLLGEQ